jgi:hypothetical protein
MKIVQLPRKVWVGSHEFAVRTVAAEDPVLDGEDGDMTTDGTTGVISIAANLDGRRRLEIVLHELTHALNWSYEIEDGIDEEDIATKHGRAWTVFWLENPRFESWLVYALAKIRREQRTGDDGSKAAAPQPKTDDQ